MNHNRVSGATVEKSFEALDRSPVVSAVMGVVAVALVAHLVTGFASDRPEDLRIPPEIGHEWLTVKAAWSGLDPYQSLEALSDQLESPILYREWSPRPPGALVVEGPLALLPFDSLGWVAAALASVCLTILAALVVRACRWRSRWVPVVAISLALATPIAQPLLFLNFVFVILALVAISMELVLQGDRLGYGIPLGLAVAMRLWPAVIVLGLFAAGRYRSAIAATTTGAIFTFGGLLFPGVDVSGAVRGIETARQFWQAHPGNASIIPMVATTGVGVTIGVVALLMIVVIRYSRPVSPRSLAIATVAAVLVSPLAWGSYLGAGLPMFTRMARAGPMRILWVGVGAVFATHWMGEWILIVALGALGMAVVAQPGAGGSMQSRSARDDEP